MRTTMYNPMHLNFFSFSNWPSLDLDKDKLFDSDIGELEDDEHDQEDSIALISSILVLLKVDEHELFVCMK